MLLYHNMIEFDWVCKLTSVIFYNFYNSPLVFLRNSVLQYKFQVHV